MGIKCKGAYCASQHKNYAGIVKKHGDLCINCFNAKVLENKALKANSAFQQDMLSSVGSQPAKDYN